MDAKKTVQQETGLTEGMAGFGTKAHTAFSKLVKAMGLTSEVSYIDGVPAKYYGHASRSEKGVGSWYWHILLNYLSSAQ